MSKKGRDTKPEDCTHPDCFSCPYEDCIWNGRLSYDPLRQQAKIDHKEVRERK